MRVLRGRAADRDADRARTAAMLDRTAETGVPALRVWTPGRQVAFGRRDTREEGYERAREAAASHGFPTVERSVGGRVVAYTDSTLAFAHAVPVGDERAGLDARYEGATNAVLRALRDLGVTAWRGEPEASFCPGAHSVQRDGKLVGVAQRVRQGAALVSGIVVVDDADEIAAVLAPVYDALDLPFDPDSVGSVARAGGPSDPDEVARALEAVFVGDREVEVIDV
jgi:lipoate-protein ligase A